MYNSRMTPNIILLGITSLLADIAGEMIFPILPIFLASELGLSKVFIGLIEGFAETSSSLFRVFAGWLSDRLGKRKPVVILGYAVSTLGKPLLALSQSWPMALVARFFDRGGKGIRQPPRDALLAESTVKTKRGGIFGFHRMMDTLGGLIGNGLTFLLLYLAFSYRSIFWLATIPAILAIVVLFWVKETGRKETKKEEFHFFEKTNERGHAFGKAFWGFTIIAVLFGLSNVGYVFLLLRAQVLGIPLAFIPLLYLVFNVFQAGFSWPFGRMADRFGKVPFLLLAYALFAVMSFGFVFANHVWLVVLLFILYGLFYAANEGISRAFVVDLVPSAHKATALGIYFTATGFAALPAGVIAGTLWKYGEGIGTFWYSGVLSSAAALLLLIFFARKKYVGKTR